MKLKPDLCQVKHAACEIFDAVPRLIRERYRGHLDLVCRELTRLEAARELFKQSEHHAQDATREAAKVDAENKRLAGILQDIHHVLNTPGTAQMGIDDINDIIEEWKTQEESER